MLCFLNKRPAFCSCPGPQCSHLPGTKCSTHRSCGGGGGWLFGTPQLERDGAQAREGPQAPETAASRPRREHSLDVPKAVPPGLHNELGRGGLRLSQGELLPPWPQLPHPRAGTRALPISFLTVTASMLCKQPGWGVCVAVMVPDLPQGLPWLL